MSNYRHQVKRFDQNRIQNPGHIGQTFRFSLGNYSQFSLQNQHFVLDVQTVVLVRSSQLFVRRIQLSRVAAANIQRIVNTNHVVATISASPITIIISITELWYYMRISDAVILSCLVLCFIHMIQIWWHEHR